MSLFGAKWSGTRAILPLSKTSRIPRFRTASMALRRPNTFTTARAACARVGPRGQQEGEEDEHHQPGERPAAERFQILEGVESDGADHEERQHADREEH